METYTGWRNAGAIRDTSKRLKSVASMEMILLSVKSPRVITINRFLLKLENSSGRMGAETATTSAKALTVHPATGTLTPNHSAISGMIPTTPISVLIIPKTPMVRIKTNNLLDMFFLLSLHYYLIFDAKVQWSRVYTKVTFQRERKILFIDQSQRAVTHKIGVTALWGN